MSTDRQPSLPSVYLISTVTALALGAITVGVPLAAFRAGLSPAAIGLVGGARSAAAALVALPVGLAADTLGRRRMLVGALVSLVLASVGLATTRSLVGLFLLTAFAGTAIGAFLPAINALAADAAAEGTHGRVFGWLTLSFHLGMSLGPAMAGVLIDAAGIPAAFALSAVLAVAGLVLALRVRTTERVLVGWRRLRAGVGVSVRGMQGQAAVVTAWMASLGISVGWGTVIALFPAFAASLGFSAATIGILFGVQSLANALSRVPLGRAMDSLRRPALWAGTAIVLYAVLLAVLPHLRSAAGFALLLTPAVVLVALVYIYAQAVIARRLPLGSRGLGMGGYSAFVFLGNAGGPVLGGAVAGVLGYAAGFAASAAVMAAIGLAHLWRARSTG